VKQSWERDFNNKTKKTEKIYKRGDTKETVPMIPKGWGRVQPMQTQKDLVFKGS